MRAVLALSTLVLFATAPRVAAAQPVDLIDAVRIASTNDEGVAIAEEAIHTSDARRREARAALLPDVSVSATVTRNDRDVSVGDRTVAHLWDTTAQAQVRMTVLDISALPALSSAARDVTRADAEAAVARTALRAATARLFIDAHAARTRLDLAEESIAVAEATRDRIAARNDAGFALDAELDQAELAVLRAEAEHLDAEIDLEDALAALAFVMARPSLTPDELGDATLPTPGAGGLRPEEDAAAARLAAAEFALRAARWSFAPTAALTGRYDIGRESLRAPDGRSWTLAMTFTWQLYDPGRYPRIDAAEVAVSVAELDRARIAREQAEARAAADRQVRRAEAQVDLTERTVAVAETAHRLMRDRFELGDATLLEMTEADVALATARLDATLAGFDRDRAHIDRLVLDGAFDDDAPDMEAP